MALQYVPNFNRFVYDDLTTKYYSSCQFENFMWHHAMITINETGFGHMIIDGEIQELYTTTQPEDLNVPGGLEATNLNYFKTEMYPGRCVPSANLVDARRRDLLAELDPEPNSNNKNGFMPVDEGYPEVQGFMDPVNGTWSNRTYNDPTCCTFRVGEMCPFPDFVKTFYGLLDEVTVWNRELRLDEVENSMFRMPQHRRGRELEAPRGVQYDYTAGRVFYARFNNPCAEMSVATPSPPPPPAPLLSQDNTFSRRLLWDGKAPIVTTEAREAHRRKLLQSPPPPPPIPLQERNSTNRQMFISDMAGHTAGYTDTSGELKVSDFYEDIIALIDYPNSCQYAYTGVPWAQPHVDEIRYEFAADATDPDNQAIPLDGGTVTLYGVGFAKSPWMKCVTVPPGATESIAAGGAKDSMDYDYGYENNEPTPKVFYQAGTSPFDLTATSDFMWSNAKTVFGFWPNSPRVHYLFKDLFEALWNETVLETQYGEITPFLTDVNDPFNDDFTVGYWEQVTCDMPTMGFPSDKYRIGVSNDGALTMSPPMEVPIMDYSVNFSEGGVIDLPSDLLAEIGPTFTASAWVYLNAAPPLRQSIFEMASSLNFTGFTGVYYEHDGFALYTNNEWNYTLKVDTDMWHHVAFAADNSNLGGSVSLWVDGARVVDRKSFVPLTPFVSTFTLGSNSKLEDFDGNMDQFKMWDYAVDTDSIIAASMFERDTAGTVAYFKFSNGLASADAKYTLQSARSGFRYQATSAPWEASSLYAVNGEEVSAADFDVVKAGLGGTTPLALTGFNFAPSPFLECKWGTVLETDTNPTLASVSGQFQCPLGSGAASEGSLSRFPFAENFTLAPAKVYTQMANGRYTMKPGTGFVDHTAMTCTTPFIDGPNNLILTAANRASLHPIAFQFQDVALSVDCGGSVSADQVAGSFGAVNGYAIQLWVMPMGADCAAQAGAAGATARKLLGAKRRSRRRSVLEGEHSVAQTVLAFEDAQGGNVALLMYDGMRFFYYDDNILDAPTSPTPPGSSYSMPDMWHLVTVTVDRDGEGYLYVDNDQMEHFTTRSSPFKSTKFTVGADYSEAGVLGSFFTGMIDRIHVYDAFLFLPSLAEHHLVTISDISLKARFLFDGNATFAAGKVGTLQGGAVYAAVSGPWVPPTVMSVTPLFGALGGASGGQKLHVTGANFAKSSWLSFMVGDKVVPYERSEDGTDSVILTTSSEEASCEISLLVKATNAGDPGLAMAPFSAMYAFEPVESDLNAKDLVIFYSFEAVAYEDDHAVFANHMDLTETIAYPADYQTRDHLHVVKSAVMVGPDLDGGQVVISPPPLSRLGEETDFTLCTWVFMDEEFFRAREATEEGFLESGGHTLVGAWKMYCIVQAGEVASLYLNFDQVNMTSMQGSVAVAQVLQPLLENGVVGKNFSGMVDTVWFYTRALKPCEVAARYFTSTYAVDASKVPDGHVVKVDLPEDHPYADAFTVSAWVYPHSTDNFQTMLTTDLNGKGGDVSLYKTGVTVGLWEHSDCVCPNTCPNTTSEPKHSAYKQVTSWRSRVPSESWSHVALTFAKEVSAGASALYLYIDGMLHDVQSLEGTADFIPAGAATLFLFPDFDGMFYDFKLSGPVESYVVKNDTQCAETGEFSEDELYLGLNEGAGDVALTTGAGIQAIVSGLTGMVVNHSYYDKTFPQVCTVYGSGHLGVTVGDIGLFTLTSRSACGRQVLVGGDPWQVTMIRIDEPAVLVPIMADTNDGNYHFYYKPMAECGVYTTNLLFGGELVTTFDTTVRAAATSHAGTYVVGGVLDATTFGTPQSMMIQTADKYLCKSDHAGDIEMLAVSITGPHEVDVVVTPMGNGVFMATWFFHAFGQYRVNVTFEGDVVMDGSFCMDVAAGNAASVTPTAPVVVEEDFAGVSDLDMYMPTNGVTLEGWAWLTTLNQDAYLIFKGAANQTGAGMEAKGYEIKIAPGFQLSASLYVGLGETRVVIADLAILVSLNFWHHYAVAYNGTYLALYLNGALVSKTSYPVAKPVKHNMYYHPLTLGLGMNGRIDEIKLWRTYRSREDIMERMYCPPFEREAELSGYFGFNEDASATETRGYSAACPANATARALSDNECLTGSPVTFSDLSVLTINRAQGIGRPSALHSVTVGMNATHGPEGVQAMDNQPSFLIQAKDMCGYCYTAGDPTAYTVGLTKVNYQYLSGNAPGTEYPVTEVVSALPPLEARPTAGFCPLWGAADAQTTGDEKGDVYQVYLNNADTTGTFEVGVFADGASFFPAPTPMTIFAGEPNTFEPFFVSQNTRRPTAGVPFPYYLTVRDSLGNVLKRRSDFEGKVSIVGKDYQMVYAFSTSGESTPPTSMAANEPLIQFDEENGIYTIPMLLGITGTYLLELTNPNMVTFTASVDCDPPAWKVVHTPSNEVPQEVRRFEHTAVNHGGDMYIFGGASFDKTYLNDVWMLKDVDATTYHYVSHVPLEYPDGYKEGAAAIRDMPRREGGSVYTTQRDGGKEETMMTPPDTMKRRTVAVTLDTATLIQGGLMNRHCMDIAFTDKLADFYMDPSPGCNHEATVYRVSLPEGFADDDLMVFHGGNPWMRDNVASQPKEVFMFFEGFESDPRMTNVSELQAVPACDGASETASLTVTSELPFAGERSLKMNKGEHITAIKQLQPVDNYTLTAWFWDSGVTAGVHFLSSDYPTCDNIRNVTLLGAATAVGMYTLANADNYCVGQPWDVTDLPRENGWHKLQIGSNGGVATIAVDGVTVKEGPALPLDKIFLSAGNSVRARGQARLAASSAFWDDISVELMSGITASAVAKTEAAAWSIGTRWEKLEPEGAAPPPRYSHTTVYHDGKAWLYGGERSGYSFTDMWTFDFEETSWAPVDITLDITNPAIALALTKTVEFPGENSGDYTALAGASTLDTLPKARFDHTAVMVSVDDDHYMVVHGGRSGHVILKDWWAFHFDTKTWIPLKSRVSNGTSDGGNADAGVRFGHAAASTMDNMVYVFGGWSSAGFSRDFLRCEVHITNEGNGIFSDAVVDCYDLVEECGLPNELSPRYSHTMRAKPQDNVLFMYGGSDLDSAAPAEGFGKVWRFSGVECTWEAMEATDEIGRFEQAMTVTTAAENVIVHGGQQDGTTGTTYLFPIG